MEEFASSIKGMNLSQLSGAIEGLAHLIECSSSDEERSMIAEKLRSISDELFDRELDSQESYLAHDYKRCDRMLTSLSQTNQHS